jgi:hypothetical protein
LGLSRENEHVYKPGEPKSRRARPPLWGKGEKFTMAYRRTVREIVAVGISTVAELQEALYNAIQLEFATIPPYLCAQWSINNNNDPNNVNTKIQDIVVQEMLHFGFGCNMYTATGGSLQGIIAEPGFVPTYPGPLPAGVHPGLTVSLLPLGNTALQTFMSIEYPDVTPVVQQPQSPPPPNPPAQPTIGQFYQIIATYPDASAPR